MQYTVAVKDLRTTSTAISEEVKEETAKLVKINHQSIIKFYGLVVEPLLFIMEFFDGINLLDRLRDSTKEVLKVSTIYEISIQICEGLKIIENANICYERFTTGQVLLGKDEQNIKLVLPLCARNLRKGRRRPTATMAPESYKGRKISTKATVYFYSIVIWELLSYGAKPYPMCTADEVEKKVGKGGRPAKPLMATQRLYKMMKHCWEKSPTDRPSMENVYQEWANVLAEWDDILNLVQDFLMTLEAPTIKIHLTRDAMAKEFTERCTLKPHPVSVLFNEGHVTDLVAAAVDRLLKGIIDLQFWKPLDILRYLMTSDISKIVGPTSDRVEHNWNIIVEALNFVIKRNPGTVHEDNVFRHVQNKYKLWKLQKTQEPAPESKTPYAQLSKQELMLRKKDQRTTEQRRKDHEKRNAVFQNPREKSRDWKERLRNEGAEEKEEKDRDDGTEENEMDPETDEDTEFLEICEAFRELAARRDDGERGEGVQKVDMTDTGNHRSNNKAL